MKFFSSLFLFLTVLVLSAGKYFQFYVQVLTYIYKAAVSINNETTTEEAFTGTINETTTEMNDVNVSWQSRKKQTSGGKKKPHGGSVDLSDLFEGVGDLFSNQAHTTLALGCAIALLA